MKSCAVGLLLCSSFLWAGSGPKPSETLVIANVNIVDTRYGGIEPNVTVIVKDSVIIAITKVALIQTGVHVRVVNAEGRYLIPGLWDMNARISGDADWNRSAVFSLYVVNGITGVRDIGMPGVEPQAEQRENFESNFPAPEIVMPGPTLHP